MSVEAEAAVYRGLTQSELDAQYDQRSAVPHAQDYMTRWAAWSADLRAACQPLNLAYAETSETTLHLFKGRAGGPLHMHLHGGAWRALSKEDAGFVVRGLRSDGTSVAVVDFGQAPQISLKDMVGQVRVALLWLSRNAACLGVRPDRITVSGHSSGAHLASCLLDARWWAGEGLTADTFAGLVLVSGAYDLEPVRLSARNGYLGLSRDEAWDLTALHHLPADLPAIRIFWGEDDLPEFRRQGAAFAAALEKAGAPVRSEVRAGKNHFDMYDAFADPASPVCRAAQAMAADDSRARKQRGEDT
ncbi:alpha/beta hydrolase [Algihabitans albus]|uniref:alpha/beta hydrolase n=1 Tax=Algihabitans albus TaxID=2164067 RepID=UPI000E5CB064|nr:alpha/beta hydrolase [Algihabitans albus]